jgi:hypothetical protein
VLPLLLTLTPEAQAQDFAYTTNTDASITITGYTGAGGNVTIPSAIDGLPVTTIGSRSFYHSALSGVTIPNSVTTIGDSAFSDCANLTQVTIPGTVTQIGWYVFEGSGLTNVVLQGVTSIGTGMFIGCQSLTEFNIPDTVTNIGHDAFNSCLNLARVIIPKSVVTISSASFERTGLTNVTIPTSVASVGFNAFVSCARLTGVYFEGNAPTFGTYPFQLPTIVYYVPGTTGWVATIGGSPTALWSRANPFILNPSAQSDGYAFAISWATNRSVIVEVSTNLVNGGWVPLQTNVQTGGTSFLNDPTWTNYSRRFYRIRSP